MLSMEHWRVFVSDHKPGIFTDVRTVRVTELSESVISLSYQPAMRLGVNGGLQK